MSDRPDRLDGIQEELRRFVRERDWEQFHNPKNLAMLIASEAGELLAELRWAASDRSDAFVREPGTRARIEAEVADVMIAALLFCDRVGLDALDVMRTKLQHNTTRYPVEQSRGRADRPPTPHEL